VVERTGVHDARPLDSLIAQLRHEDPHTRWEAARALGVLRDRGAVEPLIEALKDSDPDVRRKAALSLAKIRDPRALEPLELCSVHDENQVVRWAASWGLGRFQQRKIA
jgi:HEAT repeat protein